MRQPTFALGHGIAMQENVAELMTPADFYANHTLNGQQGAGVLIPDGEGSVVVVITRVLSDAITGFGSRTIASNALEQY